MTLRDLLIKCNYKKVFNQIYKLFLKGKFDKSTVSKLDIKYYGFFEYLKKTPTANPSIDKIYVTNTSGNNPVIDVCFFDKNKDELYSIDFVDWSDIIDLEIYKTLKIDDEECLAHILHEITFWGFDEKTLEEQKKLLRDSIDESNR